MSIICKQCGYENPDNASVCEICAEPLGNTESVATTQDQIPQPSSQVLVQSVTQVTPQQTVQPIQHQTQFVQQTPSNIEANVAQINTIPQNVLMADDGNEYYVLCPESQAKTILPSGNVTTFYCEGCKKQHEIDGFLWSVEKRAKTSSATTSQATAPQIQAASKGDNLWLEEINSHVRIDIDKSGGTLGRYGKYGAEFFQSRGFLMVSGEHCMFSYQYGTWVLNHISRTNQTMYNNMILGANEPTVLEDGKVLTLANAVTFIVRIG